VLSLYPSAVKQTKRKQTKNKNKNKLNQNSINNKNQVIMKARGPQNEFIEFITPIFRYREIRRNGKRS
jgi:hypothetical protein